MKYVVTSDGHKCAIDDSSIDYENTFPYPFKERVAVMDDRDYLRKVWILELNTSSRSQGMRGNDKFEMEFVKELRYDHKPTEEEILWAMAEYGLVLDDIAVVREAYEKAYNYD